MHGELTEVDGIRQNILLTYGKLTEGPVDAWKADRRSCYCRESSQKISRPHGKLTEVDRSPAAVRNIFGRSHGCMKY